MRSTHESPQGNIESFSANERYIAAIAQIERVATYLGINHRIVGGTFTDLLNPQTTFSIDPTNHTIAPDGYNQPTMYRADGTVKDVDMISFCPNQITVSEAKRLLKDFERQKPFPHISLEPTYYSHWPRRNRLTQMVSTIDVDGEDNAATPSLNFGNIHQPISWESVAPWKVVLDNGVSFTILNPYAHGLRYVMRNLSGVKKKDREKMSILMRMGGQVRQAGLAQEEDYLELYRPWIVFIHSMQRADDLVTRLKTKGTRFYWNTVGTSFAHGRGIFKPLASLGDRFTG